jgi:hypothetical protein
MYIPLLPLIGTLFGPFLLKNKLPPPIVIGYGLITFDKMFNVC